MPIKTIDYTNGSANGPNTGARGEERFRTYCTDNGISCFQPITNSKADFIIYLPYEGYTSVNVKTMYWDKYSNAYRCNLRTRCGSRKQRPFSSDEIDYFVIVNIPYDKIWMVPLGSTLSKQTITWHPPEKNTNRKYHFSWDPYLIKSGNESIFQSKLVKVS